MRVVDKADAQVEAFLEYWDSALEVDHEKAQTLQCSVNWGRDQDSVPVGGLVNAQIVASLEDRGSVPKGVRRRH